MNQAAVRDAGAQLPYYYKRNPAKMQDIIQSRPHSKIVWAALRLSYTEKGSTQARPSSHAAMLSAAKLIYGYRGCRFRRLLSLPLLPEVQNRYTVFSVRSLLSIKVWMMRGAVECIILSVKKLYMDITRSEKQSNPGKPTGKSVSFIPALPLRRQFWRWLQPAGGNNRPWCHRAPSGCGPQSGRSNTGHRYIQTRPNRTRCIFLW